MKTRFANGIKRLREANIFVEKLKEELQREQPFLKKTEEEVHQML